MFSGRQRLAFLAVAAAIGVVAIVILASGGGDSSTTTTAAPASTSSPAPGETPAPASTPAEVVLEPGKVRQIKVKQGDQVTFKARSDKADEVHVHGYDIKKDVPAGGEVEFSLKATITGIFVIELENAGEQIGQLVVEPK